MKRRRRVFSRKSVSNRMSPYQTRPLARNFGKGNGVRLFKLRIFVDVRDNFSLALEDIGVTTATDWPAIQQLFAFYRVTAMHLQYMPKFNVNQIADAAIAQNSFQLPIYVYQDIERPPNTPNETNALQYENLKKMPINRNWALFFRMKRMIQMTTSGTNVLPGGYYRTDAPVATQQISVVPPNTVLTDQGIIGRFQVTYYLAVKARQ